MMAFVASIPTRNTHQLETSSTILAGRTRLQASPFLTHLAVVKLTKYRFRAADLLLCCVVCIFFSLSLRFLLCCEVICMHYEDSEEFCLQLS